MFRKTPFLMLSILSISSLLPAQEWTGLASLPPETEPKITQANPSLSILPLASQDLGQVDGGIPLLTGVQVLNVGTEPFTLSAPSLGIDRLRIKFPVKGDLSLDPGQVAKIPVEFDARELEGPVDFEVAFRTNDPGTPILRQSFHATIQRALPANPFRNAVLGETLKGVWTSAPIPVSFAGDFSNCVVNARMENESAPLKLEGAILPDGSYAGTVTMDPEKLKQGASRQGETRIFAEMNTGRQTYVWIQWLAQ